MKIPAIKNIKLSKTWLVLGAALGIGLLAALGARSYLQSRVQAIEAKARGELVNVVVAKDDLPKGVALTTDNVAVRSVPRTYVGATAVMPGDFDRVEGQKLAYGVRNGEMILWGLLESKKAPTFSAGVAVGRRAITVPVDQINSMSGMLAPGDYIDLLATLDKQGRQVTVPLLLKVQVLATGREAMDDPQSGDQKMYDTVTLDAAPVQAQELIVARAMGKITALLRNPGDATPGYKVPGNLPEMLGMGGSHRNGGNSGTIPVIYGGSNQKLSDIALSLGLPAAPNGGAFPSNPPPSAFPGSLAVNAPFAPVRPVANSVDGNVR